MAVRKRKDTGRWVIDYYDSQGKRHVETVGANRKEAESRLRKIQEEIEKGGFNPTHSKMTFSEYAERWWKTYGEINLKPSTRSSYRQTLNTHILPVFGSLPLKTIKRDMVKGFVSELVKKEFSFTLIRINVAVIRLILNCALEDGIIAPPNPASRVLKVMKIQARKQNEINPFTREELFLFLDSVKSHFPDYYPLFLTLARTGMRVGEAIGLQWGDVDFNGGFIEIKRAINEGRVGTTKSGKSRRVDMSLQLSRVLSDHLVAVKKTTLQNGWGNPPEWVFFSTDGTPLNLHNLRVRVFYKALSKAKLRHIRVHDLRHTYATLLIQQGESLAYIRDQLGHHSIKITVDTYGHLVPGGNRQAVDRLDDPIFSPSSNELVTKPEIRVPQEVRRSVKRAMKSGSSKRNLVELRGFEPLTS